MVRSRAHQQALPAGETPWAVVTGDIVMLRPSDGCDSRLVGMFRSADVTFANLEAPLTARGAPAEKAATHRAPTVSAEWLKTLGITAVTVANNHCLDYGLEGLSDTLAALDAAGISHVGAGATAENALAALLVPSEHGTLALLGLSASLPPGFAASEHRPGVAPLRVLQQVALDPALAAEQPGMAPYVHTAVHGPDLEAACAAVRAARGSADLVVVAVHWGIPHGFAASSYGQLADYQGPAGRALIDAGADLVIGHHPHVVHPIEIYSGGLIAYSVGNLMFHNWAQFGGSTGASNSDLVEPTGTFRFETPSAPYRSSFAASETLDSVLVLIQPSQVTGEHLIRFLPTTMTNGDPVIPERHHCEAILDRLDSHKPSDLQQHRLLKRTDLIDGAVVGEVLLHGQR